MFMSRTRTAWAAGATLLTLLVGAPVWADDVELLLSTPASSNAAKPNILFIIDSSGSMTTVETSQEPFIAGKDYTGANCDDDYYYWTTGTSIPSCGSQYRIKKTSFVCAQGVTQISAAGSYTDTMAMYRPNNKNKWKWRQLNKSRDTNAVECKSDSGVHGYGSDPANEPYAMVGTNVDPYTADSNREVNWGVKPTHQIVTMYDSDYLSWYHNPPGSSMSRTNIVKAVTKNVLGSVKDVNVGFMRFHYSQGGPVIHGIKDLDDNRAAANTVVDGIPASGWTPLSETFYEAALYWRGMEGEYGGEASTDKDALEAWTDNPDWIDYKAPAEFACSKNFVVMLTDGAPTQDTGAFSKVPDLPGFGRSSCNNTAGVNDSNVNGACLDDIADYLQRVDINPNVAGKQTVTTYTIGFSVDLPILADTAARGGGEYFLASDVTSLTAALTEIVTDIFDRDISFTAPAVAVNAFNRTQHLNDLYVSVFRATDHVHWPGNLKKYRLNDTTIEDVNQNDAVDPNTGFFADTSKNFWAQGAADGADVYLGGVANLLPPPANRKLYTNNSSGNLTVAGNQISTGNLQSFVDSDFGLTGAAGEPSMSNIIEWMRGVDVKDEDSNPVTTVRYAMGDTLHSQPAALVYGKSGGSFDVILFNATNDGYLHAVNADTGEEMWSFVPRELLPNMFELYENENVDYKTYGIDGDVVPVVYDKNEDGIIDATDDFVRLIFGMRRGGDNYYMIDVTDPNTPKLEWIRTFPEMGQSWSSPVVAKIQINSATQTSPQDAVLVIGGGYDTSHDAPAHPASADVEGAGIFMLDLETGDQIWRAGRDLNANLTVTNMTRAIPSRIRVIDLNGDGFADRMYAADLGGQIWRFDVSNGAVPNSLVRGGVIARLGAEGLASPTAANTRRFYTTPDVAMFKDNRHDRRYLAINIGSGYRAHPLDNSASDRFYSIRDPQVFTSLSQSEYDNYSIITESDLIDVAGQLNTVIPANGDGWMMTLPANEKVLSDAQTFDNSVYFVSFQPQVNSADPCQAGLSLNRLYRMSIVNGDPIVDTSSQVPLDPADADDARVTDLEQGGIAPKPTFFFPSPTDPSCTGEDCTPPPVGCVGVECFDPGFPNFPVRTLWTQDGID
ncbi:MAG: PilC/PilY family type IV pilus protein [Woeseiaceae bacterium]|nr:PilC/PilY family type IV pilus protein [Woeseiaceae bacterium]